MNKDKALSKATVALAFVSGLLNAQSSVLAADIPRSSEAAMQAIVNNTALSPDIQAVDLIKLAEGYLIERSRVANEKWAMTIDVNKAGTWSHVRPKIELYLTMWSEQVAVREYQREHPAKSAIKSLPDAQSTLAENAALADIAIKRALPLLNQSSNYCVKLNMLFIISLLYKQMNREVEFQNYDAMVKDYIKMCEKSEPADEAQIKVAASILDSMAYALVPIEVPDRLYGTKLLVRPVTEPDFEKSQELKLKALSLVDRLDAKSEVRRRVHRDLAVWYMQTGRTTLADSAKQTLFQLVGSTNEQMLWPADSSCGQLNWWKTEQPEMQGTCGMG